MPKNRKMAAKNRTATITMAAVLVLSLITYFVSEHVLRVRMVKPIKREKVDFAKALDWLPPKAKQELEYRARYLDLKQKYEAAESNDEKLQAAYKFAIHTREMDEHNEVLLPFIRNPEKYAGTKDLYLAYMRMLYDPKNPQAITIQQYYDFINTLKEPLDIYIAWSEGRNRINRVAKQDVQVEFLKPLLDKPLDFFIIRDYTSPLDHLRATARRLSLEASKRIADKREREGDRETAASMMKIALKADELRDKIAKSSTNYTRGDYIRLLALKAAYEKAAPGENKLKAGFDYARLLRDLTARKALIDSLLKDPEYAKENLLLKVCAIRTDELGKPGAPAMKDILAIVSTFPREFRMIFWQEAINRLNSQKASAEQKLLLLSPLMNEKLEDIPFSDYGWYYDQISRCAVYLNNQALFEKASQLRDDLRKAGKQSFKAYHDAQKLKK